MQASWGSRGSSEPCSGLLPARASVCAAHRRRAPAVRGHRIELQRVRANIGCVPEHATGDAGYWNPHVEARAGVGHRGVGGHRTNPPWGCGTGHAHRRPARGTRPSRADALATRHARRSNAVRAPQGSGGARQRPNQARSAIPAVLRARRTGRRRRVGDGEPVPQRAEAVRSPARRAVSGMRYPTPGPRRCRRRVQTRRARFGSRRYRDKVRLGQPDPDKAAKTPTP